MIILSKWSEFGCILIVTSKSVSCIRGDTSSASLMALVPHLFGCNALQDVSIAGDLKMHC